MPPTPMPPPFTPTPTLTPVLTPIPTLSAAFSTVHAPIVASSTPAIATTRSSMLDHLIDEVELALHIDVLVEGDTTDVETEIDDLVAAEGAADDDARATASYSHFFLRGKGVFDPNLMTLTISLNRVREAVKFVIDDQLVTILADDEEVGSRKLTRKACAGLTLPRHDPPLLLILLERFLIEFRRSSGCCLSLIQFKTLASTCHSSAVTGTLPIQSIFLLMAFHNQGCDKEISSNEWNRSKIESNEKPKVHSFSLSCTTPVRSKWGKDEASKLTEEGMSYRQVLQNPPSRGHSIGGDSESSKA
ncbi:hypothetical protein Ancab_023287 [Ancistrocladus abbreviatus]